MNAGQTNRLLPTLPGNRYARTSSIKCDFNTSSVICQSNRWLGGYCWWGWASLSPTDLPEFWPSLVEFKDVQDKPGYVGSTYRWGYKMAGMQFEGQTECIECTPGERIVMKDRAGWPKPSLSSKKRKRPTRFCPT